MTTDYSQSYDGTAKQRLTQRIFFWWADHVLMQIIVFVVMTGLAIIGHTDPGLVSDLFESKPVVQSVEPQTSAIDNVSSVEPAANPPVNVEPFRVGGGECILTVIVHGDPSLDVFSRNNLTAVYRVVEGLEELPQVKSIFWIDNIPEMNLFGLSGTMMPSVNASPRQLQQAREKALSNPFSTGQMISADGRTLLLHLSLDWFYIDKDEAATDDIRVRAEQLAAEVPGAQLKFLMTGHVPLQMMVANNHLTNALTYQLVGYGIMFLSALVLFRGFSAVSIVAVAPALGVFWTLGFLNFFGIQDNPFNDIIVPVLVSLVGLTDAVHLMVEIRQQRADGHETPEAARRGIARVGLACLLTSVTTAIGFISLTTAHHEVVREFGWCCVVGIAMTFVSVLTVTPLGCRSPLGRRLHVGLGKSVVDGQLKRIGPIVETVLKNYRVVSIAAIVVTVGLGLACLRLKPDEKRYSGLSESGEPARGLRHLDQSLGGLEFGYVSVQWVDGTTEAEILSSLQRIDDLLKNEPLLGNPLGLHQLLETLPGDGEASERMALLDLFPPSLKRAFYTPEYRSATVQFRIQDRGIAAYSATFERLEKELAALSARQTNLTARLDGGAYWRWKGVYQIVRDLATSLGTASLVIWIVLTIVYRSIRIGLISIIPNVFPLVATGAVMVVAGQYLEMVTVCVFTICVGIAVDDTIHFLTRYHEELHNSAGDHEAVIRRAFTGVGSALLMTTIVLVTGLASATLGDARDARLFGLMGSLTLATALFADIILLPALLKRFARSS